MHVKELWSLRLCHLIPTVPPFLTIFSLCDPTIPGRMRARFLCQESVSRDRKACILGWVWNNQRPFWIMIWPWSKWAIRANENENGWTGLWSLSLLNSGRQKCDEEVIWLKTWHELRAGMASLRDASVLSSSCACAHMNTHTYSICFHTLFDFDFFATSHPASSLTFVKEAERKVAATF